MGIPASQVVVDGMLSDGSIISTSVGHEQI